MKESPKWYLLVEYWCRIRKPRGYGLTIPFILGSISNYSVKELIYDVTTTKTREYVILRYCSDLEEYVLSLDDLSYQCVDHLKKKFGNMLVNDDSSVIESFLTTEEVVSFFEKRYVVEMSQGKYSKNRNHEWGYFTEEDNWRLKLV